MCLGCTWFGKSAPLTEMVSFPHESITFIITSAAFGSSHG